MNENLVSQRSCTSDTAEASQPENLASKPQPCTTAFDHDDLDVEKKAIIEQRTHEIKDLIRSTQDNLLKLGEKLKEVQELLRHNKKGGFRHWIASSFGWGTWTAYKFIRVWQVFGNCVNFTQLRIATSALYQLAASSTPTVAREKALALAGEGVFVTHKLARQLIAEHKPKKTPATSDPLAQDLLKKGDMVELLNPPPESGWNSGDRAIVESVYHQDRTVLLELDTHQIGRQFRSFSFDEIRKVNLNERRNELKNAERLSSLLFNFRTYVSLSDIILKNMIKAAKRELSRRHRSAFPKSGHSSMDARFGAEG